MMLKPGSAHRGATFPHRRRSVSSGAGRAGTMGLVAGLERRISPSSSSFYAHSPHCNAPMHHYTHTDHCTQYHVHTRTTLRHYMTAHTAMPPHTTARITPPRARHCTRYYASTQYYTRYYVHTYTHTSLRTTPYTPPLHDPQSALYDRQGADLSLGHGNTASPSSSCGPLWMWKMKMGPAVWRPPS